MNFPAGTEVRVEMTKWVDRPHWEFPGFYLGADEYGDWIGFPAGTLMTRPGVAVRPPNDQVGLVPRDAGFLATFHAPGGDKRIYVDMTTVPQWDGTVVRAVDLDLDVVLPLVESAYVDDEDEFAEHQVELGYPAEVIELAETTCATVLDAVRRGLPPFDGSAQPWLDRLASRTRP